MFARVRTLLFVQVSICGYGALFIMVLKASHFSFCIQSIDRFLQHRWITFVGAVSYGIYLFHVPIGLMLTKYVFDPIWLNIPFDMFGPLEPIRWHSNFQFIVLSVFWCMARFQLRIYLPVI